VLLEAEKTLDKELARAREGEPAASPQEAAAIERLLRTVRSLSGEIRRPLADAAPLPAAPEGPEPLRRRAADRDEAATLRVSTDRLDRLVNLVGELVVNQSIVSQTVASYGPEKLTALKEAVGRMDRHARELYEGMMATRMVPLRHLFGRFPRLVRDLAAAVGKQVDLQLSGEETELDKTVIDKISDPLTHLIRNAIDHGLERPDERRDGRKPEIGTVSLGAYQQGGNIYIEVADDGRGLDRERILARAVRDGLVAADQALSDAEVLELIYRPGFSTADSITEVSGRGVGMDVVKRNLEALGGSMTTRSDPGKGTRFRIKLPLTLAILDGQTIRVGDQTYLLPLAGILESIRPGPGAFRFVPECGEVVVVRGRGLPLLRLDRVFDVRPDQETQVRGPVVIIEHAGASAALAVDEILGQQQVVIKSLERNFHKVEGITGATILGDGRVALILDVAELVALTRTRREREDHELVS
jgi:two-component system, chemotaxis family, sensor kinase CheA